ncbi:MAG: DegT/DnrJ/EryC1/StrS family aminotransferase, partial [Gammaproteobacteria bacterium]|nr:DegT/DnrJ/EryC1/StrS family aminotransferase [Gammaproteobacteria bacterium]
INAYFGLTRLDTINTVCMKRYYNFLTYNVGIKNEYWKPKTDDVVSSFAYPLVTPKREKVINVLEKNNIETRPIICGSITRQPFYIELFGKRNMQNADIIYNYGMYLPNHEGLSEDDIIGICKIVNEVINEN